MSDDQIVLLTAREYKALKELIEWARNSGGVGLVNTPFALTSRGRVKSRRSSGEGVKFRWCTVVTVHADHLICRPMDTTYPESSQADFPVAKPNELRKSEFDGVTKPNQDGVMITYSYAEGQTETRTAEDDEGEEEQTVVPAYVPAQTIGGVFYPGSMLLVMSGLSQGTRVTYQNAANQPVVVRSIDVNLNGRAFAEVRS
jgi:hypothetical protein